MNTALVTLNIKVDGTAIDESIPILSITCQNTLDKDGSARITIPIDNILDDALYTLIDSWLAPGKRIDIFAGHDSKDKVIFSGTISAQILKLDPEEEAMFFIECRSDAAPVKEQAEGEAPVISLEFGVGIISFEKIYTGSSHSPLSPGRISIPGNSSAVPGKSIRLKGMFDKFTGLSIVSSVIHSISKGNWLTTLELGKK